MSKPSSAIQPQLALEEPVRNRGLFADHFLKERLSELPQWQEAQGLAETFDAIKQLYDKCAPTFTEATNEDQTENDFIQLALDWCLSAGIANCMDVRARRGSDPRERRYRMRSSTTARQTRGDARWGWRTAIRAPDPGFLHAQRAPAHARRASWEGTTL